MVAYASLLKCDSDSQIQCCVHNSQGRMNIKIISNKVTIWHGQLLKHC